MIQLINLRTSKNIETQKNYFREPNLGILYLAAILEQNDIPVDVLDLEQYVEFTKIERKALIKERIKSYQIFGITSLTNTYHIALETARIIKNHIKNSYIILGGPHVTFMYQEILENDKKTENLIDFVCIGEAERSFLNLVKILISKIQFNIESEIFEARLKNIGGLAFIDSRGNLNVNQSVKEIEIESLPLPARHLLSPEYHYYTVATVIANRGCPNQCSFCSRQKLFKKTKIRSVESILAEVRDIIALQTYNYINFYDNINISKRFFRDFCKMFIDNDIKIPWGCELRIDIISDEDARMLKEAGCKLIATGIESASVKVLQNNFKIQDPELVKNGLVNIKKYNIPVQVYFVLGLPGETESTFAETINYIKDLHLNDGDTLNYFIATPYPGSRLWDEKKNFKINIIEHNFAKYDCDHIIFETEDLNREKLKKMFLVAKKVEKERELNRIFS